MRNEAFRRNRRRQETPQADFFSILLGGASGAADVVMNNAR